MQGRGFSEPTLTDMQRLQLQNGALAVELWQMKAQQAQSEFEKARAGLKKLIADVTPAGYQMNEKMEFEKLPEKPTSPH